jgi:spore coat protein U-like protein
MIRAIFLGASLLSILSYAHITGNFAGKVHVNVSCVIKSSQPMHWPILNGTFLININNTTGSVTTQCTKGASYTVGINNGQNYDSLLRTRRLLGQGHYVQYAIYSDQGYLIPWGNVGTPNALSLGGTGLSQTNTLYARIPKGQSSVPPGNYQDSLVVTLNF